MKLASFEAGGGPRAGIVLGDRLIDLSQAAPALPLDMARLIAIWDQVEADLRRIAQDGKTHCALQDVRLLAPVPRPQKILAIGLNYADHIAETGARKPDRQVWFSKLPSAVNGPFDPIERPKASADVDYEAELVAVIGKRCRHVTKADAAGVVFGYCCGNDVSVRDWQRHTPQWILGKSFDTHAPMGPWITTADEVGDPHALGIRCFVNGEKRQDSNTSHLIFRVPDQIALLTEAMTLMPGDCIFTGTPSGVGMAMNPPNYLKAGDTVRVEIDKLGAIEARVQMEA